MITTMIRYNWEINYERTDINFVEKKVAELARSAHLFQSLIKVILIFDS